MSRNQNLRVKKNPVVGMICVVERFSGISKIFIEKFEQDP